MSKLAEVIEVSDCRTVTDILNRTATAWEPVAKPIKAIQEHPSQDGMTAVISSGFHAIVRPDTMQILGVCSKRYKPNSHVVHLARLDNMVRHGDLVPERVSIWDHGSLMAFQFRAPVLDAEILPGDSVSPLLTLAFYNDGKHGDMSFFADFRWSCTNQLGRVAAAMSGNKRTAHRGDVHGDYERKLTERIDEMRQVSVSRYDAMRRMTQKVKEPGPEMLSYWADALSLPSPTDKWVEELMAATEETELTPHAKQLQQVLACYRADPTAAPGTVWQSYNALTRYLTHSIGRVSSTRQRRALMGAFSKEQESAFQVAALQAA